MEACNRNLLILDSSAALAPFLVGFPLAQSQILKEVVFKVFCGLKMIPGRDIAHAFRA